MKSAIDNRLLSLDFVHRAYKTSAMIAFLVLLFLCAAADWRLIVNYCLGYLTGLGFMVATEVAVGTIIGGRAEERKKAGAVLLMAGKYGALVGLLYLLVRLRYLHPVSFAGGVLTLQAVLFLKAIGLISMSRRERETEERYR